MNIWTAALMAAMVAIGYQTRGTVYVILMSLYTRFINWKN